jgi:hypothetical protein
MKDLSNILKSFPRQLAMVTLASAIAIPLCVAQDQVNTGIASGTSSQSTPSSATQQQPSPEAQQPLSQPKEGFWGRVYPFARKKWVKRQLDPINDRLTELDEVNAKNAQDIKDVDARAQAGIRKAQASADAANQLAMSANSQAQSASNTAQQASSHVDRLNSTVDGLDQYHQITDLEVKFHGESPALTADSKTKLDELASSLTGRDGYILEMDAYSPLAGSAGIQSSERLAESVERYLVTEHQIPIYRMHFVALGNQEASAAGNDDQKPERVRASSVHLVLMENSLAARAGASPQSASAAAGAEQP